MPREHFLAGLFIITALLTGCEKSEVVFPSNAKKASEIYGRVNNWQFGDSMAISAAAVIIGPGTPIVLASGSVRSDGTFFLSLPQPPQATLQRVISPYDILSDTTAKLLFLTGLLLSNPEQSRRFWLLNLHKVSPDSSSPNDFEISHFYSDRPVWWRRTQTTNGVDTLVVVYDLHLDKGWNRVIKRTEVNRPHYVLSTLKVDNVQLESWYILSEIQP